MNISFYFMKCTVQKMPKCFFESTSSDNSPFGYCPLSRSRMHLKNSFTDQVLPLYSEIHFAHTYIHTHVRAHRFS